MVLEDTQAFTRVNVSYYTGFNQLMKKDIIPIFAS